MGKYLCCDPNISALTDEELGYSEIVEDAQWTVTYVPSLDICVTRAFGTVDDLCDMLEEGWFDGE